VFPAQAAATGGAVPAQEGDARIVA
jgi:hypothetical protein